MKNKIKKIVTATICSVASITAIGCGTANNNLAKKINKGMDEFVSSINNLDYVDTSTKDNSIGKIVSVSSNNEPRYISETARTLNIENTITRPTERTDNFKLFVLSDMPYVSLTSDNNTANLNLSMQFSTEKIENTSDEINEKINELILKRSILMIYANEIQNGNVNLTQEDKTAINAYVNVIKENASFLKGNKGIVKNQLNLASDLINNNTSENLVNYYIIKSGEALEIRSNKIDSTISAIDSIINIIEQNLTDKSTYYQTNLSETYNNLINNTANNLSEDENTKLAKSITESLSLKQKSNTTNQENNNLETNENDQISTLESNYELEEKTQNNVKNIKNTINNSTINAKNQINSNENTNQNRTQLTKDIKQNTIKNTSNTTNNYYQNKRNEIQNSDNKTNTQNNRTIRATRVPSRNNQNINQTSVHSNDNIVSRVPHKTNIV